MQQAGVDGSVELWAGIECTVNRVGDRYFDQLLKNGHETRIEDIDRFADLGVRALRYPVLWEKVAPDGLEHARWDWADARLARLRARGVRPIVGLVHHGSGPRHTSLLDPGFADGLAAYARAVAERYPWVEDYTPVNEPLTTARFSALYGIWYPHATDDASFVRALLVQCRAVAQAMSAIREVNPRARLIQTEDLGKTWSTPEVAEQAAFENERRWLSFDLLCGRVDDRHPLRAWLRERGAGDDELAWFTAHPCPPDILGINHYLTSERYLDHRIERFPADTHGGNGENRYADVEAVRACEVAGPERLLRETWDRYRLPIAVTEAHLHCTREEQLRWFMEVWDACTALRADGVDLRAVTAWAGLGSYDWVSLLTRDDNVYEAGVFDLRGGAPRPTAIAHLLKEVGAGRRPSHPLLAVPGWWRRDVRILHDIGRPLAHDAVPDGVAPLLITGRTGTLGQAFARLCRLRGIPVVLTGRGELDIADEAAVAGALERHRPWAVVNAAGYVRVPDAETDVARCWRENVLGPETLARATAALGIPLVAFSSDLVFDGRLSRPYHEDDSTAPLSVYGRSKAEAEAAILRENPRALVARTAAFFSPWDDWNFVTLALRALGVGREFAVHDGVTVSPTYVPHLVHAALDLLIDGECGIWHLANAGETTWLDLARSAARRADLPTTLLTPIAPPEWMPRYTALTSGRARLLPALESSLDEWWAESRHRIDVLPAAVSGRRMTAASARREAQRPR